MTTSIADLPPQVDLSVPLPCPPRRKDSNQLPHQRFVVKLCSTTIVLRYLAATRPQLWERAEEDYLNFLDSLVGCKERMDAKGIHFPRLEEFLERVDKIRSGALAHILNISPEALADIMDQASFLLETWPKFRASAPAKCGIIVNENMTTQLLPDAPKVLSKSTQRALVGGLYLTQHTTKQLYRARPKLPEDEWLLLTELRNMDYEYRSERIVERDHGGVWPAEGILLSRRRLTDVHLFFQDPSEVVANVEHVTDAIGVGNHLAP